MLRKSTKIAVVGLGPGDADYLSVGALAALKAARTVLVRTSRHPTVGALGEMGITSQSLDRIYEESARLEEVYARLAQEVIDAARAAAGLVAYAVPGHPTVAEQSVKELLSLAEEAELEVELIPSISAVDLCLWRLGFDPVKGIRVQDAQREMRCDPATSTLYIQLDSRRVASEVKLALLEGFPPEHEVVLLRAVGSAEAEKVERVALAELDRRDDFDHLTSLFVPALEASRRCVGLPDLVDLMARLRSEEGCPWDREQDHQSLKPCLQEEAEEVLEAIDAQDPASLCEELGDLLLQVLFHAQLAAEAGQFDMNDIMRGLHEKLIERHPHVFGEEKIETADAVLEAWEAIKRRKSGQA